MKTLIIFFMVFMFFALGCKNSLKKVDNTRIICNSSFNYDKTIKKYIDSFSLVLTRYKDANKIMPIGFVEIESMKNNSVYKIRMECVYSKKILRKIRYDDCYFNKNIFIIINFNMPILVNLKNKLYRQELLRLSKITKYQSADIKFPTWLFLMKNKKICKINKNANSKFIGIKESYAEFTDKGLVHYEKDEWGNRIP